MCLIRINVYINSKQVDHKARACLRVLSTRSFMAFWLFGNEYFVSALARARISMCVLVCANVSEKTLFDEFIASVLRVQIPIE